jgi:hypothetical protein
LNTVQPAAERATAHAPRADADEPAAEESLQHHAKRVVSSKVHALERAVLDPAIALLQGLRKASGAAEGAEEEGAEDRSRSKKTKPGRGRDADEDEAEGEAPKPKRRLLTFLIYFSMMLAGCMLGGALAYELLANLLERQATESRRLEAAMSKQSKSVASNQKKLAEAEAKRVEAETKLEESKKKQAEAEKKLEAAINDTKAAAEKQKKLDDAVKLLEQIRGSERSTPSPRPAPASSGTGVTSSADSGAERKPGPSKTGDCNLAAGNVNALKDCVKEFNR